MWFRGLCNMLANWCELCAWVNISMRLCLTIAGSISILFLISISGSTVGPKMPKKWTLTWRFWGMGQGRTPPATIKERVMRTRNPRIGGGQGVDGRYNAWRSGAPGCAENTNHHQWWTCTRRRGVFTHEVQPQKPLSFRGTANYSANEVNAVACAL